MFKIIRISAVVGAIAILSPVHDSPGTPDPADVIAGATSLAEAAGPAAADLGVAWRSLSGEMREGLGDLAVAEARRRMAALDEPASRDTLTATDRRIPWRGPAETLAR